MAKNNATQEYEALKRKNRRRLIGASVMVVVAGVIFWRVLASAPEPGVSTEIIAIQTPADPATDTTPPAPMVDDDVLLDDEGAAVPLEDAGALGEALPTAEGDTGGGQVIERPLPLDEQQTAVPTQPIAPTPAVVTPPAVTPVAPVAPATKPTPKPVEQVKPTPKPVPKPVVKPVEKPKPKPVEQPKPAVPAKPAKPAKPSPQDILDGKVDFGEVNMAVQVVALSDAARANEVKQRLSAAGLPAYVSSGGNNISRVRLGPFKSRA
nr:SPOR domain-containing protein [Neisseriaceae bacterium]